MEGFMAYACMGIASVFALSAMTNLDPESSLILVLIGAVLELFLESVDNLTIPVILSIIGAKLC